MPEHKSHSAEFSRNMSYNSLVDPTSSVKLSKVPEERKTLSSRQKILLGSGLFVVVFAIVLTVAIVSSNKNPIKIGMKISKGDSL